MEKSLMYSDFVKTEKKLLYSDFIKLTTPKKESLSSRFRATSSRSLDTCAHRKLEHISHTETIDSKFYEAICGDCSCTVYSQTGKIRIPWTKNKSVAHGDSLP